MDGSCSRTMLCVVVVVVVVAFLVAFVPGVDSENAAVRFLSRQDVLLLKDEPDPKCFTRTGRDFTCFFEAANNNKMYDLLYRLNSNSSEIRCEVFVQRSEDGTLLHICSFPSWDVFLYVEMHIRVVDQGSDRRVCSRSVSVEDNFLMDPPSNVSLLQTGEPGRLQVTWKTQVPPYCGDVRTRIHYWTEGQTERTEELQDSRRNRFVLGSVEPGEQTQVQVSVTCSFSPSEGIWSHRSQPVTAVVPQSADDVSLTCFTSDLQNFTCRWNGSRDEVDGSFRLYYRTQLREDWSECLYITNDTLAGLCRFHGDESRKVQVKLANRAAPLGRTFYTREFSLNKSIRTSAPAHVRGTMDRDRLCVKWAEPLLSLSAHLLYEVRYQTAEAEAWTTVSVEGPQTGTCLQVAAGSQYRVEVRAKARGAVYSGQWSDWSHVLTAHIPTDTGLWLILCVPVTMLLTAVLLISAYLSKLKQYFWPPVPNLDKVLHNFLTEMDKQRWDPPLTVKHLSEETAASVVEIVSEDVTSGPRKPAEEESSQLLPPEGALCGTQQVVYGNTQVFPDYVTLNKDRVILRPSANMYTYEVEEKVVPQAEEACECSGSDCDPQSTGSDFLNYSYEPLRVTAQTETGNIYTNLPCS